MYIIQAHGKFMLVYTNTGKSQLICVGIKNRLNMKTLATSKLKKNIIVMYRTG